MARSILTKKLLGKRSQAQVCRDVMAKAKKAKQPDKRFCILIVDENGQQVITNWAFMIRSLTPLLDTTDINDGKTILTTVEHIPPLNPMSLGTTHATRSQKRIRLLRL